ncbi:uncharacterized protein LOC134819702 [Bolinopsis microptera]|uniref:uncharacterized protein LOC134819702 n=1 Tax=Bolinopsis microptera TaxID=2820187 RepID=UPI00307A9FB9
MRNLQTTLIFLQIISLSLCGWLPVEREVKIEWDPESTPLEIKTNSVLGSNDHVYVFFYSAEGQLSGGVVLRFGSTPHYWLLYCSPSYTNFPVKLPSTADKVWRITLTRTAGVRIVIQCNEVEVLNILLSYSTCRYPYWRSYWNRDVAKIQFHSSDTASDYYGSQPVSCTGLKAEWRTAIRTTTKFPVVPGTVVEVNCIESRALNKGSSEVTCTSGTEFIFNLNEPECINTGTKTMMYKVYTNVDRIEMNRKKVREYQLQLIYENSRIHIKETSFMALISDEYLEKDT